MSITNTNGTSAIPNKRVAFVSSAQNSPISHGNDTRRPNKFVLHVLVFYLFLIVSRILDLSPISWMRIPLFLLVGLAISALAQGEFRFVFSSKITRTFALFAMWTVISFPFSVWRGGSMDAVRVALESFVLFVVIVQNVRTEADWRKIAGVWAYSVLVAALYSFLVGRYEGGRLSLIGGTFGDPNELALTLLIGLPFWWLKAGRAKGISKIFFWACTLPIFLSFLRTGSRAGLLALGAMLITTFFLANMGQKVLISIVAFVGIAVAAVSLPPYLKARYLSMFSAHATADLDEASKQQLLGADLDSSSERQALLRQSIKMTFEHPIFGVGPGVFSYAAWDERKATEGTGGLALVTHNTYTQISSETGIPGFIFFALVTIYSIKYPLADYRLLKDGRSELAKCARYLLISWVTLAVGIFFLSVGYTYMLAIFFALAASLHNVVGAINRAPTPAPHPAPASSIPTQPAPRRIREPRRIPKFSRASPK